MTTTRTRTAATAALLLGMTFLFAGCFGGDDAGGLDDGPAIPADAPAQCDPTRPATAHHAGGVHVNGTDHVLVPCLSKTYIPSREPTIGIASDGTLYHYPAMTGDNVRPTGVAISRDQGATWEFVMPDVAGVATHTHSLDPYFFLDPTTDRIFADDLITVNCSMFSWSDDQGASWDHSLSGCLETDHQTIFTGAPVSTQTLGYPNIVYRCAINAVAVAGASTMATCQNSIDGGRTWLAPGQPAYLTDTGDLPDVCHGAVGHGATDAQGTVYLPKVLCDGTPMLAISHDEAFSWTRTQVSDRTGSGHDAGVGADPAGNIYYFFVDGDDRLPYLTISSDGGQTWSDAVMVGHPDVNEASQPEMIVGGTGKIAFVYMGTTNSPGAPFDGGYSNTTWNAYVGMTANALDANATFYSAPVNDPELDAFVVGSCGSLRCQGVQDFLDVRIGPDGTAWGAFVDDCLGIGAACSHADEGPFDTHRVGAVGWLFGGPSLWDADDPNGHYPN